jgi:hypothetical protein
VKGHGDWTALQVSENHVVRRRNPHGLENDPGGEDMSTEKDDILIGDADELGIREGEDDEPYEFYLVGPDRGAFGFDAREVQDIRSMLDRTLGDG